MYLGIDVGTSNIKIVIIDETQSVCVEKISPLTISHPQELWSEQQPEDWWNVLEKSLDELAENYQHYFAEIKAIGLTGQMHGAVCLDKNNQVIRPAILWNDGRSFAECDFLLAEVPEATKITGNLIMPGFTAPKLVWLKKHEPENFSKINKVLLPKDYIRFCLTNDFATDLSDASGTSWLNVQNREWSNEMINACDLSIDHMPCLYEGSDITGELKSSLAKKWHMKNDVKVIAGGGDNAASAIAVNVVLPGSAFLSLGTSAVIFTADEGYHPDPDNALHTMCHCLPQKWHQMSVHLNATGCIQWIMKTLNISNYNELNALAREANKPPLFLPYLNGERTPFNYSRASGQFLGLTENTTRGDLCLSVLQGTALAITLGFNVVKNANPNIDHISVIGGGSKNLFWGQIFSDMMNHPLHYHSDRFAGAAVGVARLARYALTGGSLDNAFKMSEVKTVLTPNRQYQRELTLLTKCFQQLKPIYEELLS